VDNSSNLSVVRREAAERACFGAMGVHDVEISGSTDRLQIGEGRSVVCE
jgi:hypothetical protein